MATWSKLFTNFAWKNRPDTSTPLGQTLLNRLNTALNGIDDRVVTLNAEKASTDDLNGSIVNVRLDEKTGIFTFTRFDGTTFTINTALEEVVTNFRYDYATQSLVLTLADGTTQNIDLSALITQYEFTNSATILFTVGTYGKVEANIKPNSITDQMLQTNYLADITTQANTAVAASQSALESQSLAEQSAEDAHSQADRAKSEADRAKAEADRAQSVSAVEIATTNKAGIVKPDGETIKIEPDGTISAFSGDYEDLENKPQIPTKTSQLTNDSGFKTTDTVTKVKGNAETSYRTGNVNLTPANIGALPSSGGTITSGSMTPLILKNSSSLAFLKFIGTSEFGSLGFNGVDNPAWMSPTTGAVKSLLHDENGATVETGSFELLYDNASTVGIYNYIKIGKLVFVYGVFTAKTAVSCAVGKYIYGLPFTVNSNLASYFKMVSGVYTSQAVQESANVAITGSVSYLQVVKSFSVMLGPPTTLIGLYATDD